jgi:peptide/nickel transport system substrate-binding protein
LIGSLNFKEKILFLFLLAVLVVSSAGWGIIYYYSHTKELPSFGGEYIEGIVGQPLYINPVLADSNETDADLARIVYSGLFKYDGQGKLLPDLAERYEISEDKTVYKVYLKKNVLWHDGESFMSDDVIFTIHLISDPSFKSPLRSNWQGITTNRIDDYTLEFKIENPYAGFLNNLTFGILPKHLWESVPAENFSLHSLNIEPIGTGPYKYNSVQKDSKGNVISYKLVSNPVYFEGKPYISKITFNFYIDEDSALDALNRKEIMGIDVLSAQKVKNINTQKTVTVYKFNVPSYFAVFLNQTKNIAVASDEVREALSYATDRQEIINQVLEGNGQPAFSPFIYGSFGYTDDLDRRDFNLEKANEILDRNNWKKGEDGFRGKDGNGLEVTLITLDWEDLVKTIEIIKTQWEKIGVKVNVNSYSLSDIRQNYIRPREYDALLFGQIVGADPDPYFFWHSDNKKDPGANLSLFDNKDADKIIEEGRQELDAQKRTEKYIEFQKILNREIPAIFLYNPQYLYPVNKNLKGIDIETLLSPSKRFSDINHWYIKTKRVKK